jgi:hypothetical protein
MIIKDILVSRFLKFKNKKFYNARKEIMCPWFSKLLYMNILLYLPFLDRYNIFIYKKVSYKNGVLNKSITNVANKQSSKNIKIFLQRICQVLTFVISLYNDNEPKKA